MGKQFDELAKALANGVSRRAALKRFAVGTVGAAFASVFTGRNADAQLSPSICQQVCSEEFGTSSGRLFGRCVSSCASCIGRGGEPTGINPITGEVHCVGLNSVN
jgi:hypothetical protein